MNGAESQPEERARLVLSASIPTKEHIDDYITAIDAPVPFTPETVERSIQRLAEQMIRLLRLGGAFPPDPTRGS